MLKTRDGNIIYDYDKGIGNGEVVELTSFADGKLIRETVYFGGASWEKRARFYSSSARTIEDRAKWAQYAEVFRNEFQSQSQSTPGINIEDLDVPEQSNYLNPEQRRAIEKAHPGFDAVVPDGGGPYQLLPTNIQTPPFPDASPDYGIISPEIRKSLASKLTTDDPELGGMS